MPPRYAYWTIILEGKATAFRARTQDELLPTFKQLHARHPDTALMWFARGRLWPSPAHERAAAAAKRAAAAIRRDAAWRPGGEHRDPRDRFKIPRAAKRRRFAAKLRRDRDDARLPGAAPSTPLSGRKPRSTPPGPGSSARPDRSSTRDQRPPSAAPPRPDHERSRTTRPVDAGRGPVRGRRNPRGRGGRGSSR